MKWYSKIMAGLAVATSLATSAPAQDTAPATKGAKWWLNSETKLRLCTPAWRNIGEMTPQEAAKKFRVIFGHLDPKGFKEGDPNCITLKYMLGPYTTKGEMQKLPTAAMAKDKDGNVIKARDWANWLVVPDSKEWIDYVVAMGARQFEQGFDGLFTDSMGTAPVEGSYLLAVAINPNTGKPYDKIDWLAAERKMAEEIRKIIPQDKILTMNGLGPGTRYWTEPIEASPRILLEYYDGAMSETIFRHPGDKLDEWRPLEEWMLDVKMIQDVEKRGIMGYWWSKCWTDKNTSNNEPNADKLVPQWRRYCLGSYLLGAGPNSYFNFDTMKNDKPKSNAAEYFVEYDAAEPLGTATGEMTQIGDSNVYYRTYSGGLVVVNPTDKALDAASIPGTEGKTYKSWGEDRTLTFPATIEAHTGLILTEEK